MESWVMCEIDMEIKWTSWHQAAQLASFGAVILVHLKIPIYIMITILMMGLNHRCDSFAFPVKPSGPHHPACLATTQDFVPGPCRQRLHFFGLEHAKPATFKF